MGGRQKTLQESQAYNFCYVLFSVVDESYRLARVRKDSNATDTLRPRRRVTSVPKKRSRVEVGSATDEAAGGLCALRPMCRNGFCT